MSNIELKIEDEEIAMLQDIAHNNLNIFLNYLPLIDFPFSNWHKDRIVEKKIKLELSKALELVKTNSFLLHYFGLLEKKIKGTDLYEVLRYFLKGLSDLMKQNNLEKGVFPKEILLSKIPLFNPSELKFSNPENVCLDNILNIFKKDSDLFEFAFIDGSLGSNDYIPGWSDVDIFAIISDDVFCSKDSLFRVRMIFKEIKKEIFSYHRLQVHPVFFAIESDLQFNRHKYFPLVCLQKGKILSRKEDSFFLYESRKVFKEDAYKAYNGAYEHFIYLKTKRNKSTLLKVLYIHRLFLFPIFYLATKGVRCYKADSFDLLPKYMEEEFGIDEFCSSLKEIYKTMSIQYSHCFWLRRMLMNMVDPTIVNSVSLKITRKQVYSINELFDRILSRGLFEKAEEYWMKGSKELSI